MNRRMKEEGAATIRDAEMLVHAASVGRALCMCAPYMQTQDVRDRVRELGQRLVGLAPIDGEPGGIAIAEEPIRAAVCETGRILDGLLRLGKN